MKSTSIFLLWFCVFCICLYVDGGFLSGGGTVDFQEFVGGLSAFSSRGGREEKLRCKSASSFFLCDLGDVKLSLRVVAFKVYDMDRDGFISNGELFLVLKMMVGSNLKVPFVTRGCCRC